MSGATTAGGPDAIVELKSAMLHSPPFRRMLEPGFVPAGIRPVLEDTVAGARAVRCIAECPAGWRRVRRRALQLIDRADNESERPTAPLRRDLERARTELTRLGLVGFIDPEGVELVVEHSGAGVGGGLVVIPWPGLIVARQEACGLSRALDEPARETLALFLLRTVSERVRWMHPLVTPERVVFQAAVLAEKAGAPGWTSALGLAVQAVIEATRGHARTVAALALNEAALACLARRYSSAESVGGAA